MSILALGVSMQQRVLKRAFPNEDFSHLQSNHIPIFNDDTEYVIEPNLPSFLEFLSCEASDEYSVAFEISPFFAVTYFKLNIRVYTNSGLRNFYTAIPVASGTAKDAILFPLSTGAVTLQFSETLQHLTAVPFYSLPSYATTLFRDFCNFDKAYYKKGKFYLSGLSPYRYSETYML